MNECISTGELLEAALRTDEPGTRYVLYQAADALSTQEPIEWIVQDLISAGSLSIVVGEPGSKKTYSMLDLSVAVAAGGVALDTEWSLRKLR